MDFVCETLDTGRRWTPPDGGELGLAGQLDYLTFHLFFFNNFYFNLNINNLTWELEVPGTWELEVPGTWELRSWKFQEFGNFGTWELRNLGTSELGNSLSGVQLVYCRLIVIDYQRSGRSNYNTSFLCDFHWIRSIDF